MNIVGRSYMLITTGGERVNRIGVHTFKTIFFIKNPFKISRHMVFN